MALKRYGVRVPAAPPPPLIWTTYTFRSERNGCYYIGSTGNTQNRLEHHNAGGTKSAKPFVRGC